LGQCRKGGTGQELFGPGYQMSESGPIGGKAGSGWWFFFDGNRAQLRGFCRGAYFFAKKAQLLVDTIGKFL